MFTFFGAKNTGGDENWRWEEGGYEKLLLPSGDGEMKTWVGLGGVDFSVSFFEIVVASVRGWGYS